MKKNRKMSTCNRLDLETLGIFLTAYAQILPKHLDVHLVVQILRLQKGGS